MHLVFFVNFLKIYLLLSFTSSPPLTSPHLPSPPLHSPPLLPFLLLTLLLPLYYSLLPSLLNAISPSFLSFTPFLLSSSIICYLPPSLPLTSLFPSVFTVHSPLFPPCVHTGYSTLYSLLERSCSSGSTLD